MGDELGHESTYEWTQDGPPTQARLTHWQTPGPSTRADTPIRILHGTHFLKAASLQIKISMILGHLARKETRSSKDLNSIRYCTGTCATHSTLAVDTNSKCHVAAQKIMGGTYLEIEDLVVRQSE